MPFVKGQSGNPGGLNSADRAAVVKIRKGIDKAIDRMKNGKSVGIVAFQEKMAESFENNFLATLKAVAPLLPKDITVENTRTTDLNKLTDNELAEIVAQRARAKHLESQIVDADYEEVDENKA